MAKRYWLMKSEPDVFSIDDLKRKKREFWDGVRNYQARNFMREMALGDEAFFYHSNTKPPAIVGLMKVSATARPDLSAQDPKSEGYDPKSKDDAPRWSMVELSFLKKFTHPLTLEEVKNVKALKELPLVRTGNRLSVMPVTEKEWFILLSLIEDERG